MKVILSLVGFYFSPQDYITMGEKVERYAHKYLIVTMGEGLWEDADMGVGQREVHKLGTEKN